MRAWKKTVALLMALGMSLSIVACGDTGDSQSSSSSNNGQSSTGGNGGDEASVPTTPDEIFAYVMDAMDATKAYTGSVTMTAEGGYENKMVEGQDESKNVAEQTYIVSYDSVNKVRYMEESEEDDKYGDYVCYSKTFAQGENFYGVEKGVYTPPANSTDEPETEEDYFLLVGEAKTEMQAFDFVDEVGEVFEMYDGVSLASSVAELKTALETALPVLLAEDVPDGVTPTLTVTTTTTSENSVYTFAFAFDASFLTEDDGQIMEGSIMMSCLASAKDGKIVALDIEAEMAYAMSQTVGTETTVLMSQSSTSSQRATIEYAFAQAKYDAFTVVLPTNPDDIEVEGAPAEEYEDLKTFLYVNGVENDTVDYWGVETPAQAYERIVSRVGISEDCAEVKVYKDAEFTQELKKETITKADVLALEKVYLKVTPKTGFALVRVGWTQREEYSKTYQIVLPIVSGIINGPSMESDSYFQALEAEEYTLNETAVLDPTVEIWVNGEKMATKTATITVAGGQSYSIEYVRVVTDPVLDAE